MLDAYRFVPTEELKRKFPNAEVEVETADLAEDSEQATEKTELEQLEDEVRDFCIDLLQYFYKKYGDRWGVGSDGELKMRGLSKLEVKERTMLVPFKTDPKETDAVFVGISSDSFYGYSLQLDFHFVDAKGKGLGQDFNIELQDVYAQIVDPTYRNLTEILKDDEAFALTLLPAREDVPEASASHQMVAFLQEEFDVNAHLILTVLLKYFSEEVVWEIKRSYLQQHHEELLTQFRDDLFALNQRINIEGFSNIVVRQ